MIEGVLRHCTDMEIDRQYVDSHGQTTVAFAFCHLLGFELKPRLKDISRQKLHKAEAGQVFGNLKQVIAPRAIAWELIEEYKARSGTETGHGRRREHPSPLYTEQHPAPGV